MKYESTILKRLIDTYGVVGNPRYISEIIKEFIVRGKERFPELFTYQADWLAHIDEFGLNPSYTVSYTGQSIYAPNTLERPVKSAILSGNTLVNIPTTYNRNPSSNGNVMVETTNLSMLKSNTKYLLKIINKSNYDITYYPNASSFIGNDFTVNGKSEGYVILTSLDTTLTHNGIVRLRSSSETIIDLECAILFIEYKDGMENWDIPYFEGMQSVKIPVLKATGKNLFDLSRMNESGGINDNIIDIQNNSITTNNDNGGSTGKGYVIKGLKKNTPYKVTVTNDASSGGSGNFNIGSRDGKDWYSQRIWGIPIGKTYESIVYTDTGFLRITINTNGNYNVTFKDIQIEEGSTATDYEPYKSNILSCNEEVILRGIGDVRDELDLLTGEVTQRIGELVLDGSGEWKTDINGAGVRRYFLEGIGGDLSDDVSNSSSLLCDKFKASSNMWIETNDAIQIIKSNGIFFIDSSVDSLDAFVNKLKATNIKVQYSLIEKPVKTVDLTILDQNGQGVDHLKTFNGGTHFNTGSLEGSLPPSVSVCVVTDLEEILMVCSSEGNTM